MYLAYLTLILCNLSIASNSIAMFLTVTDNWLVYSCQVVSILRRLTHLFLITHTFMDEAKAHSH